MNQGMWGHPSGQATAGRKVLQRVGHSYLSDTNIGSALTGSSISSVTTSTLTSDVRNRIYAVSGKGACRVAVAGVSSVGTSTHYKVAIVVDGITFAETGNISHGGGNAGLCMIGRPGSQWTGVSSAYSIMPDYIPFDSSFEIYFTPVAGSGAAAFYGVSVDIHQ